MSDFLVPYQSLLVGHEIFFSYFADAPTGELPNLSSGVICSIEVQVGTLLTGKTTVQTLLGLVPLMKWLEGCSDAEHVVALEFMESVAIESFHAPKASQNPAKLSAEEEPVADLGTRKKRIRYSDIFSLYWDQRPAERPRLVAKGKHKKSSSKGKSQKKERPLHESPPSFYVTKKKRR